MSGVRSRRNPAHVPLALARQVLGLPPPCVRPTVLAGGVGAVLQRALAPAGATAAATGLSTQLPLTFRVLFVAPAAGRRSWIRCGGRGLRSDRRPQVSGLRRLGGDAAGRGLRPGRLRPSAWPARVPAGVRARARRPPGALGRAGHPSRALARPPPLGRGRTDDVRRHGLRCPSGPAALSAERSPPRGRRRPRRTRRQATAATERRRLWPWPRRALRQAMTRHDRARRHNSRPTPASPVTRGARRAGR